MYCESGVGGLTLCCGLRLLDLEDLGLLSPDAVSRFVRATAIYLQDIVTGYGQGKGKGRKLVTDSVGTSCRMWNQAMGLGNSQILFIALSQVKINRHDQLNLSISYFEYRSGAFI